MMRTLALRLSAAAVMTLVIAACQTTRPGRVSTPISRLEAPPPQAIHNAITEILSAYHFDPKQVGFMVYDPEKARIVAAQNADTGYLPASVNKVASTLVALAVLGPSYRYETSLLYRGKIAGGTLTGDLFLRGGGDPLLMASDLMSLAQSLQRRGIRKLNGRLFYDSGLFPESPSIDNHFDDDAAYNSGVAALSSEFNRFRLTWAPGSQPGSLAVFTSPAADSIRLDVGDQSSQFLYHRSGATDEWSLPRDLRRGSRELPVKNAAYFTATLFAELAGSLGIELPAPVVGSTPREALLISMHQSLPLLELVKKDLEYSNNLMTELFAMTAARRLAGRSLSLVDSAHQLTAWLKSTIKDASWSGYVAENGSGLSPAARLTPRQAVSILRWGDTQTFGGDSYLSLLPVSGYKGTLRDRLDGPETAYRVWAKTGTIDYGSALAGYFLSRGNHKFLFALFFSDFEARGRVDATPPDRKTAEGADAWTTRARRAQDEILTRWIREN